MTTPTVLAYCCSVWEVTLPWGLCGLCGERPTMTPNPDAADTRIEPQRAPRLDPRTTERLDSTAPRGEYRSRQVSERTPLTTELPQGAQIEETEIRA